MRQLQNTKKYGIPMPDLFKHTVLNLMKKHPLRIWKFINRVNLINSVNNTKTNIPSHMIGYPEGKRHMVSRTGLSVPVISFLSFAMALDYSSRLLSVFLTYRSPIYAYSSRLLSVFLTYRSPIYTSKPTLPASLISVESNPHSFVLIIGSLSIFKDSDRYFWSPFLTVTH